MARAERVVLRFLALAEAGKPTAHANGADTLAPTGEDFMRIGLMAHIPDQLIGGRVEHMVQGDGQLHHAEARTEMPAGLRYGINRLAAQIIRELLQLLRRHASAVSGRLHTVEHRSGRVGIHRS